MFKSIGQDEELQAHLKVQMDEVYGPDDPKECFCSGLFTDCTWPNCKAKDKVSHPLSDAAVTDNLTQAAIDGKVSVDMVNLPPHYAAFQIEPIRFAQENSLDFLQSNIIKYVVRWKLKNGLEDLAKAKRCLEMYIRYAEGNQDWWKREAA